MRGFGEPRKWFEQRFVFGLTVFWFSSRDHVQKLLQIAHDALGLSLCQHEA